MGLSHCQPLEMVRAVLVLFVLGLAVCPPPVFDDYFNEDVKIVDVSQDSAIKACVNPSTPLVTKISRATKACLGGDDTFDWEDFSKRQAPGPNKNVQRKVIPKNQPQRPQVRKLPPRNQPQVGLGLRGGIKRKSPP